MSETSYEKFSDEFTRLLAEHATVDIEKIKKDAKLVDGLGLDSFTIVELLYEMEMKFGITISNEELKQIITVEDVLKLYKNKKNGSNNA